LSQSYAQRSARTKENDRIAGRLRYLKNGGWRTLEAKKSPEQKKRRARQALLRRQFGMTPDDYNALLFSQHGCCAICQRPERCNAAKGTTPKLLAVDHDHTTGAIRGLLCHACNLSLGGFEDRLDLLEAAYTYLLDHS